MKREAFNVRHPWFRPLWVRVLFTGVILGWAVLELGWGQPVFGMISGVAGIYLVREFFWVFDPANYERTEEDG